MKIVPKLSNEQLRILNHFTQPQTNPSQSLKMNHAHKRAATNPPKLAEKACLTVEDRVEIVRDVPGTAYRAGQRGVIEALHGNPAKIAEVRVNNLHYCDSLSLDDLRTIDTEN